MPRETDRDLFPRIMAALLFTTGGAAAWVAFEDGFETTRGSVSAAPGLIAAAAVPMPAPPRISSAPSNSPGETSRVASPQMALPQAAKALPSGQVWQCVANGQKTFSDSPCGAGAAIRQLNDVNRMAPASPVTSYAQSPSYPDGNYGTAPEPPAADETYAVGAAPGLIAYRAPRYGHHPRPQSNERLTAGGHAGSATR